ncbi:pan domain-containing protein [Quercus suber]|uniref:Pan domain-containing protein n=1 Tax=Quercus suber TaxID=58331 RepID=A0AAW0MG11_QUESU
MMNSTVSPHYPSFPTMDRLINWLTRLRATQLLFLIWVSTWIAGTTPESILQGFKATPNPSVSSFQPLLNDPTGNFSLGFLRVGQTQLALAVLHVASSQPLWLANPTQLATWSDRTQFLFNGSLVISDPNTRAISTKRGRRRMWIDAGGVDRCLWVDGDRWCLWVLMLVGLVMES